MVQGRFIIGDFVRVKCAPECYKNMCGKIISNAQSRWSSDAKLYYEVNCCENGSSNVILVFYEEDLEHLITDWGDGE